MDKRISFRLWPARISVATTNALCHLRANSFALADAGLYAPEQMVDFSDLADFFNRLTPDPRPGNRERANSRLALGHNGWITLLPQEPYVQYQNADAQEEKREFVAFDYDVIVSKSILHLIATHVELARLSDHAKFGNLLEIDLHAIRYRCEGVMPSFSSPLSAYIDDEDYVAVILIQTHNVMGDVNYISGTEADGASRVRNMPQVAFRLQEPLHTMVLGAGCRHAVGVMASNDGNPGWRDILIVTIKPLADVASTV